MRTRGQWKGRVRFAAVAATAMAVLGWASPSGLAAQRSASTLSGDTITLSLDDALSIAEAHNPAYQKAVNITRENGADMRQAWFNQVLPQARLNLFGTQYLGRLIHVGTDFYGNPVARPVANWIYSSSTNQSVQLNWTIEGASILNALRSQRLTNAGRDVDKAAALTTTRIEVERRYMDALGQRELLEAEEELLASRRIDEEVTKRLFSLAQGSQVDVLKAELDVQTQTQAVQQQRATFGKALLDLRTELGDPGLQPFRLDSVALPIFDPSSLEADALVAVALQRNPDVEKAKSAVDLAQVSMSEGRDSWWPTLNMSAYLGRTAQSSQTGAVFNGAWTEPVDKNFSVSLSFPMLNNFFGTRQRQVQASVNLDNAKEDARQQRLTTEQNVRSDLLDLRSRWSALQVANTSAGIAAKAVELARAQYRMGTIDFQGLRTSINDDANVRRSLITARQAFVDALLSLEAAVGTPVGPTSPGGGDAPGGR